MHQTTFFRTDTHPEKNWGWIIEYRLANTTYDGVRLDWRTHGDWKPFDPLPVYHFRTEWRAHAVLSELLGDKVWDRKVQLGLIEFRVIPKYLGYVPPESEKWIE